MPRAGLDRAAVVAGAAALADEVGLQNVTMSLLAERLGVRAPSLYKHVDGQADINHGVAVLALTELGDALERALGGTTSREALSAAAWTMRTFIGDHPGRYAATLRLDMDAPRDDLVDAGARVLGAMERVLEGYDIDPDDRVHALRALRSLFHGFAVLESVGGFQMDTDVDASFAWLVELAHRGLRTG